MYGCCIFNCNDRLSAILYCRRKKKELPNLESLFFLSSLPIFSRDLEKDKLYKVYLGCVAYFTSILKACQGKICTVLCISIQIYKYSDNQAPNLPTCVPINLQTANHFIALFSTHLFFYGLLIIKYRALSSP